MIGAIFGLYGKTRRAFYLRKIGKAKIGKNCILSDGSLDDLTPELIEIGDNCILATGAKILTHDASPMARGGETVKKRVRLGSNVFVGFNAIILPGVTIGDNVVINAGSVVNKDIPDNCIVGGNPAKIITRLPQIRKP